MGFDVALRLGDGLVGFALHLGGLRLAFGLQLVELLLHRGDLVVRDLLDLLELFVGRLLHFGNLGGLLFFVGAGRGTQKRPTNQCTGPDPRTIRHEYDASTTSHPTARRIFFTAR